MNNINFQAIESSGTGCMFMLDVNTGAKVHAGAMHWSQIDFTRQSSERRTVY